MKNLLKTLICVLALGVFFVHEGTFADETNTGKEIMISESGAVVDINDDATEKNKEREKTINDINAFLIESYKLKIDKILSDLNKSIVRVTKNDPNAQVQLLQKIQKDITVKIEVLRSRRVSENRKIILGAIFTYIQGNIDTTIRKISKENTIQ